MTCWTSTWPPHGTSLWSLWMPDSICAIHKSMHAPLVSQKLCNVAFYALNEYLVTCSVINDQWCTFSVHVQYFIQVRIFSAIFNLSHIATLWPPILISCMCLSVKPGDIIRLDFAFSCPDHVFMPIFA
jgi:hypothetical protein